MDQPSANPLDTVEPIPGEPLRFHVRSRRQGVEPHLVDLEEWRLNGRCNCEHFEFRLQPELARGAKPGPAMRCWHIQLARQWFLDFVLSSVIEERNRITNERKRKSTASKMAEYSRG
jgi:hypothetical protein